MIPSFVAQAASKVTQIQYVALGDSLAFGIGANGEKGKGYPDYVAATFASEGVLHSFNKGFSFPGYTTTDVLRDLTKNVTKPVLGSGIPSQSAELQASIKSADLITISAGANDVLPHFTIDPKTGVPSIDVTKLTSAIQQVGTNYKMILAKIYEKNPQAQVYVMGYYNPFPHLSAELQPQINDLLNNLNGSIQLGMAGTNAIFVSTSEEIAKDFSKHLPNPQNIHLSETGYQLVATKFTKQIKDTYKWIPIDIPTPTVTFSDMTNHWAKAEVEVAVKAGVIKGYGDGTFRPHETITRVQATAMIVRALQLQTNQPAPFKDIGQLSKATQAEISAGYYYGLVKGNKGAFNPNETITLPELALLVSRTYTIINGQPYVAKTETNLPQFKHYNAETQKALTMLHELGLIGKEGISLASKPNRAQAVYVQVKLMNTAKVASN